VQFITRHSDFYFYFHLNFYFDLDLDFYFYFYQPPDAPRPPISLFFYFDLDACFEFWTGLWSNDSCGTADPQLSTLHIRFQTTPVALPQGTSRVAVCPMTLNRAEGTLHPAGLGRARLGQRADDQEGTPTTQYQTIMFGFFCLNGHPAF
jgi:hypothetical protein